MTFSVSNEQEVQLSLTKRAMCCCVADVSYELEPCRGRFRCPRVFIIVTIRMFSQCLILLYRAANAVRAVAKNCRACVRGLTDERRRLPTMGSLWFW